MPGGKGSIVVIGGANLDIRGRAGKELDWKSSNPAKIWTGSGGVGRNIAENLGRLGRGTVLFSAVGNDYAGRQLLEETARAGVNISRIKKLLGYNTGIYLAFLEKSGDMVLGMSDMEILETINPDYIYQQADMLKEASMVIADTNLSSSTLKAIEEMRQQYHFPLVLETVSVAKAQRAIPLLGGIKVLATNKEELQAIIPGPIKSPADFTRAGEETMKLGPEILLLKLGPEGLFVFSAEGGIHFPSEGEEIIDATGAGDSLVAAFAAGLELGMGIEECSHLAIRVASLTLKAFGSVSPEVSPELIEEGIG